MTRSTLALIAGLGLVVVVIWAAAARLLLGGGPGSADAGGATPGASQGTVVTALPADATAGPASQGPTDPEPIPTDPQPSPSADAPGEPTGDPRLAFAEFLLHLDDARVEVADLNAAITTATADDDPAAVRRAAVDMLRFTDRERDWLLAHPPADCFAPAHRTARQMVEAYADVAERAIDWLDAAPGLDALDALADLGVAASAARDALLELGRALEAATCLR